jgi:hypothetical protein
LDVRFEQQVSNDSNLKIEEEAREVFGAAPDPITNHFGPHCYCMHLLRQREILVQDKRLFDAAFEAVYLIKVSRHFPGYLRQK